MTDIRACSVNGCGAPLLARGWCKRHYDRWRRHGDPHICLKPMVARGAPMQWLIENAEHNGDDCLIWPFARHPDGRAHMRAGKPSRIMCELAHGQPPTDKHEAAHSCGKGYDACVNPQHLRWATPVENTADKVEHGTLLNGSRLPQAKLTENQVREIRALKGKLFQREIAAMFGVQITCINKILNGKSWRHVR